MTVEFLTDDAEVGFVARLAAATIDFDRDVPEQVFLEGWADYVFFDYAHLHIPECWQALSPRREGDVTYLVYLDPDYRRIKEQSPQGNYGIISVPAGSTTDAIGHALSLSPTDNRADMFFGACMKCLVLPASGEWAIYGDRYWDLAVAAFPGKHARETFLSLATTWKPMTAEDAIEFVRVSAGDTLEQAFSNELIKSYRR